MKYFIKTQTVKGFTAGSKLLDDIYEYLENKECIPIPYVTSSEKCGIISRKIFRLSNAIRILRQLGDDDELITLHPYVHSEYIYYASKLLRKKIRLNIIIIDIQELRSPKNKESYLLMKCAKRVVVHTDRMREYLVTKGIDESCMSVLHFFDYKVGNSRKEKSSYGNKVLYVGNIDKSGFVAHVDEDTMPAVDFHVYGKYSNTLSFPDYVHYEGCFDPDDLSSIIGDWGLVWDGENTERCGFSDSEITLGSYLRYNCSHKISMYLSAGIPLIVWDGSSLAQFVRENHLGVVVASLRDVHKAICISDEERILLEKGVEKYGNIVRTGGMLELALFDRTNPF